MYLARIILPCLFIFGWNLSLYSASGFSIPMICKECDEKKMSFYVVTDEFLLLKYTGKSLIAYGPSTTNSTVIGGILDDELYKLYKIVYYWESKHLPNTYDLRVHATYFNSKYDSYKNALNYPDGIVKICIPVHPNALIDNPQFEGFEKALDKIKYPGKFIYIKSPHAYKWFLTFPPLTVYRYYKSEYVDEDTGKKYPCATTVMVTETSATNFISCKQFKESFGSLTDGWGKHVNNPQFYNHPTTPVGIKWGIEIASIRS